MTLKPRNTEPAAESPREESKPALAAVRAAQQAAKEHDWHRVNLALADAAKLLEGT